MKESIILLEETKDEFNTIGPPVIANGFSSCDTPLITIAAYLLGFVGNLVIEGTGSVSPTEPDWYVLKTITFEKDKIRNRVIDQHKTVGFNIEGNFTYLRARVDRSHLVGNIPTGQVDFIKYGYVGQILMNF